MKKAMYTAVTTSVGGRSGHIKSPDGLIDFDLRPPKEMNGPDGLYMNPELLFAAGFSACFGSALSHIALVEKIRIKPSITAKVSIYPNDNGQGYYLGVELDIQIPELEQKEAEELAKAAHQLCPYSNATRNNIEVVLKVKGK